MALAKDRFECFVCGGSPEAYVPYDEFGQDRVVPVCHKHLDPPAYEASLARLKYSFLHLLPPLGILAYALVVVVTGFFVVLLGAFVFSSATTDAITGLPRDPSTFDTITIIIGLWSLLLIYLGAAVVHRNVWTPLSEWWNRKRAATRRDGARFKEWREQRQADPRTYPLGP